MNDTESLQLTQRYLDALIHGDAIKASEAVTDALSKGLSPSKVYSKVLVPSLTEVGSLWHAGKLGVAEEHLATQITIHEMTRVKQLIKPKSSLGKKAVVAAVDGERHMIGARVVADFLYMDGWEVDFLGASLPADDLIKFVNARKVDLVGLSITLPDFLPQLEHVIEGIKKGERPPKIIVGGSAIAGLDEERIAKLGTDGAAKDGAQAVALARSVCGLADAQASLNQYLKGLGERIQQKRKSRNYTQQELAGLANLDRAYISSVEHGKQNMTIGAIYKLAEALEIPLEELLVGGQ